MIDLRASPFFLSEESITWVQGALSSMTPEEKIGQLFCITAGGENPQTLGELVQRYQPGGFMFRSAPAAQVLAAYQAMDKASKIPLLLPANLEAGGNGIATEGTYFAKEMEIAATEDPEQAHRLGEICGCEAGALGCNWSFAPIIDIDYTGETPSPTCELSDLTQTQYSQWPVPTARESGTVVPRWLCASSTFLEMVGMNEISTC